MTLTDLRLERHPGLPPDGAEGFFLFFATNRAPCMAWWGKRAKVWEVVGRQSEEREWPAVFTAAEFHSHAKLPTGRE